ncbi:uncharacterized protein J3R85_006873 [Psidium guajava]|nr:uncharacterized protein J3R85_006873 [Psidium guajava]
MDSTTNCLKHPATIRLSASPSKYIPITSSSSCFLQSYGKPSELVMLSLLCSKRRRVKDGNRLTKSASYRSRDAEDDDAQQYHTT